MNDDLFECCRLLMDRHLSIAFAESATAGRMMAEFSMMPDAGKFLKGGIVCYDACLKEDLLYVPHELIEQHTAESQPVTAAIAVGLQQLIEADIHVGITGLTSPGGSETPEKPVGTMFIHAAGKEGPLFSERVFFTGSPEEIIQQTIIYTAKSIRQLLEKDNLSTRSS